MAKFRGAELVCLICGGSFKVPPSRAHKATTCSHACSVIYRAQGLMRDKEPYTCIACGTVSFGHRSHAAVRVYCSNACKNRHMGGEAKRKGLSRGENNGQWKGGVTYHSDGYMYEKCYGHPFGNKDYVLQHRLVAERHLLNTNPTSRCLVEVGGNKYLDPDLVVHHKNQIRDDNRIENLQIMTGSAHQALHNRLRAKRSSNI